MIGPTGFKGNIEDFANLSPFSPFFHRRLSLSQQVRMDLLFLPLFFLFFFWGNEESRTTGGWLAFVHWKAVVEKFATVIDGERHNRMKDDITGLNIFLYLIYYGGVR